MINYYNYPADKDVKLSPHFSVGEFVTESDYGGNYPSQIPIDNNLIEILEQVYSHFGCDCAIISSGYRTPECDISVGGSGGGYHTKGMAADVCFYKDGEQLPSRLIACYAQDIGVLGIGYYCGGAEFWTHLDARTEYAWFGDERDYSCGYDDFYGYTGTSKTEVYGDEPEAPASGEIPKPTLEPITSALTVTAPTLWRGDTGRAVYVLQALLMSHGYGAGGVDGIFGAGTESAVRSFQYQNALEVDGIAGPATMGALCS